MWNEECGELSINCELIGGYLSAHLLPSEGNWRKLEIDTGKRSVFIRIETRIGTQATKKITSLVGYKSR